MTTNKKRLLIVDDNEEIHADFKKILVPLIIHKDSETQELEKELFGDDDNHDKEVVEIPSYDIDDAYQGEDAVSMVDRAESEGNPYSLIFMDIRMPPGMDGIETIKKIWDKNPDAEVVICTAYSDYSWNQILKMLGQTDHLLFIKKPFDGVTVKQITLTVTTKFELGRKNRDHLKNLKSEVEKQTAELRDMMLHLEELKDKAEAAAKAKSEFLANMSHEIRTPMNAVIGFAELLKNTTLSSQQKEYVDTICDSGDMLLSLINDILDISKIDSQRIELEKIDFDLEYCIVSVLKILRQRVGGKPVDLNLAYPESVPRYVKGDPTRIRQVFMNIIGNAIKFTENGEVTTKVELNNVNNVNNENILQLNFSIKDTGIGIPPEKQNDIFDAFTQVDSSITRKYGGTGLGLKITKSLVSLMGGNILVKSEPGKGSEFSFTLNLAQGSPVIEKNISPVSMDSLKGRKIVIVDDNAQSREILSSYCNMAGMNMIQSFDSAVKILAWLTENDTDIDIILSDIMMPVMDGYTLAAKIKAIDKLKKIKLVALTSDALPGNAEHSGRAGFDAYLSKPFTKDELFNIMRVVLGDTRSSPHQIITRHLVKELSTKGISVLVVEDNILNQKLMVILLKQMGCEFDIANNGKEAVEKVGANVYDIILMDIQMPIMDGYEATRLIRNELKSKIPIIALTAHVFKDDDRKSKDAGMNDFLTKPVATKALREKILTWFEYKKI